jgi:oligoendopeptidase F
VSNGKLKTADDLDALSQRVYSRFWATQKVDEFKTAWMKISLMFEDPFYDINYVYGSLLALNFYAMYLRDRAHFVPRYIALLKNGFDAPPAVLLKRFLNHDLRDPHLLTNALSAIEARLNLLEKSY